MATRTSLALATAPPAPASTANVGTESATSTTPVVVPLPRLDRYPFTITSSLARAVRGSPQMKPKQLHCARVLQGVANRLATATILYLLTRLVIASLSRTLLSRSLELSLAFSSVSGPGDILSGGSPGLANATRPPQPPLLQVSYSREQSRPSASTVRTLCEPQGVSPWSFLWHLFNSCDCALSHVFGTSLGIRANPAILTPAMIQRIPAVHFRHLGHVGLTLVRAERHHLLNHTPRLDPIILQLHSTSGR